MHLSVRSSLSFCTQPGLLIPNIAAEALILAGPSREAAKFQAHSALRGNFCSPPTQSSIPHGMFNTYNLVVRVFMPATAQSDLIALVRDTRQRLGLSQAKFAAKLGVSFQSVNRWENGRTQPLPIALKQIESVLHQMGDRGQDLLDKHFSG